MAFIFFSFYSIWNPHKLDTHQQKNPISATFLIDTILCHYMGNIFISYASVIYIFVPEAFVLALCEKIYVEKSISKSVKWVL